MRIGCLAWGSLVWDPRTLPCADSFRDDGPWLPIEFSRIALDGRVTLIIDPSARKVRTLWVPLAVESLEEAVMALGHREMIAPEKRQNWVGQMSRRPGASTSETPPSAPREIIALWLQEQALDGVVWTALPARGPGGAAAQPDFESLLRHLKGLEGAARIRAEEYIQRTPSSINTGHRARFTEELGLIASEGGD